MFLPKCVSGTAVSNKDTIESNYPPKLDHIFGNLSAKMNGSHNLHSLKIMRTLNPKLPCNISHNGANDFKSAKSKFANLIWQLQLSKERESAQP